MQLFCSCGEVAFKSPSIRIVRVLNEGHPNFPNSDVIPCVIREAGDMVGVPVSGDDDIELRCAAGGLRGELIDDSGDDLLDAARLAVELEASVAVDAAIDEHPPPLVAFCHGNQKAVPEPGVVHPDGHGAIGTHR